MTPEIDSPETWGGSRVGLRAATGLPPALYTDGAVHVAEIDRVFHRAWVAVGLVDELRRPGTVLVRPVGDRSILLTVDADSRPRGFLNACRHRGTELAESDCSVRNTIRCPYHRWGYALDGRLVSTPRFEEDDHVGHDRDRLGLVPVRVDSWGCLVFACLDVDTPPLMTWLGDLPERMSGYDLGTWGVRESREIGIAANWKLITENFQECYHLPWVHPALATVSRVEHHHSFQGPGMYCGQTTTPVSDSDGGSWLSLPAKAGLDEVDSISGRHIAIFPNVIMSVLPNHAFVARLVPDGPGRTRETCTWLLPSPDVDDTAFRVTRDFWLHVNDEDIDIVERGQRGLSRGAVPPGPLVPGYEASLHRFHNMLADLCTAGSPAGIAIPPGRDPIRPEPLSTTS